MICKYCTEEVEPNRVLRSYQPHVFYPWKHAKTGLFGCFDANGNLTGRKAEPKEK